MQRELVEVTLNTHSKKSLLHSLQNIFKVIEQLKGLEIRLQNDYSEYF